MVQDSKKERHIERGQKHLLHLLHLLHLRVFNARSLRPLNGCAGLRVAAPCLGCRQSGRADGWTLHRSAGFTIKPLQPMRPQDEMKMRHHYAVTLGRVSRFLAAARPALPAEITNAWLGRTLV